MKSSAKSAIAAVVLVVVSAVGGWWLIQSGPEQAKVDKPQTAPAVEVQELGTGDRPVAIVAFGTVEPARLVSLSPDVSGRVIAVHDKLEPGALVKKGEVLLRIDPADYLIGVRRARAALDTARAELLLEEGNAQVAQKEWDLFKEEREAAGKRADETNALALRKPQMQATQAKISTAEAALSEAQLLVSRTELRIPFDAFVLEEGLEVGGRVEPNRTVATLVGVESFWAKVSMPIAEAGRLDAMPLGTAVDVSVTTGLGNRIERKGRFIRRLPNLEAEGRMARALIEIPDPLGITTGAPRIPLDAYVRATIDAGVVEDGYQIPRRAMRENGQVWVRDAEGKLRFRQAEIVWRGEDTFVVRAPFEPGDHLVTSYLPDPIPGIELRVRAPK